MIRRLSPELTLYFGGGFPARLAPSSKRHEALIGIGGNVGHVRRRFKQLLHYLRSFPAIDVVATSPVLQNPPFGYLDQADFFNAVLIIRTNLEPLPLLRTLLHIEKRFGRRRSFPNAPRTLDLDIIFFESKKLYNKQLTIPHPHWKERESVLIPMSHLR